MEETCPTRPRISFFILRRKHRKEEVTFSQGTHRRKNMPLIKISQVGDGKDPIFVLAPPSPPLTLPFSSCCEEKWMGNFLSPIFLLSLSLPEDVRIVKRCHTEKDFFLNRKVMASLRPFRLFFLGGGGGKKNLLLFLLVPMLRQSFLAHSCCCCCCT